MKAVAGNNTVELARIRGENIKLKADLLYVGGLPASRT